MDSNLDHLDVEWEDLARYFSGNASATEQAAIKKWAQENPELFNSIKKTWEMPTLNKQAWDTQAGWQKVNSQIKVHQKQTNRRTGASSIQLFLRVAAVLTLIATGSFLYYQFADYSTQHETVATSADEFTEYKNPKGARSTLRLKDGSTVILAADSRLIVNKKFGKGQRTVHLEGQAYFDIKPNSDIPFIVDTDYGSVKVLGTEFNVNTFADHNRQEVAVAEGVVAFQTQAGKESAAILEAGTLGILPFQERSIKVKEIENMALYTGWSQGKLVFDHEPVPLVCMKLERWYDIECSIEDSTIKQLNLTGTFESNRLSVLLDAIALSFDISYKRKDSTVVFFQH